MTSASPVNVETSAGICNSFPTPLNQPPSVAKTHECLVIPATLNLSMYFKKFLSLASFAGAPYSLDETGVMKCVFKAGRCVGASLQITEKVSVNLSHVDRRPHEPTRDRSLVGRREWDIRRELEVPSLAAVGVITRQAERSF